MSSAKVWLLKKQKKESVVDATIRGLKEFSAKRLLKGNEKVLIKPNWIIAEHYSQGNTTSTETLEGIVKYLLDECHFSPNSITIGEGGYPDETDKAIEINEVRMLEKKYGIRVININNDPRVEKRPENPLALKSVKVAQTAEESDVIISVPSLKTHSMAFTTLSLKNLMGVILPKGIMHGSLHKKIADLVSIYRSKMRFSVIDGYIGSDGMEEGGNPVKMDVLLVSEDPVALDTIGSELIGYTPIDAEYLRYSYEKGLGTCNLAEIEVIGEKIDQLERKFER